VSDVAARASLSAPLYSDRHRSGGLAKAIEDAAHLLPSQAPIQVFVHHNTLHALEGLPFQEAVLEGAALYGCQPYLPEDRYRAKLTRGRIRVDDLSAVLIDDLGDEADRLVSFLATRYHLRLAMLQYPLHLGSNAELVWLLSEGGALKRFPAETPAATRNEIVDQTRRWVMRDLRHRGSDVAAYLKTIIAELFDHFDDSHIEHWSEATWESFTLHLLWAICRHEVRRVKPRAVAAAPLVRPREFLLHATGIDSDRLVNEVLIRFCAAFLDQGIADWPLPAREQGFFRSFAALYRDSHPVPRWLRRLPRELKRIDELRLSPLDVIDESLRLLGIDESAAPEFLAQTLLALRGWAGMCWQLETNADWAARPAPPGTLNEYVAVRLLLERLALRQISDESLDHSVDLCALCSLPARRESIHAGLKIDPRAFLVFQLAENLGWSPRDLDQLSEGVWSRLIEEVEAFSGLERRRIYQLAFERRLRIQVLDAITAHARVAHAQIDRPKFQLICCLDEREESFRRHLEEIVPACETFGTAGFFGVAMFYRGVLDVHDVPLCPVVVKPRHYVREEVVYSFEDSHRRQTDTRRALGKATHRLRSGSVTVLAGWLTAVLGALMSIPLLARVLFPRLTSRVRRIFGRLVEPPPPMTRLLIERTEETPGPEPGHLGYTVDEMTEIAEKVLREIGMTARFARLVIVLGHGSSSLNNPHASAYDCGACGGGRGGPNARAFAGMLNDPRVRERLADRGLTIPRETVFLGGWHNTCEDSVTFFDLHELPSSHHGDFEVARSALDEARERNAHERCRRFESAELSLTPEAALRHVEGRAEDLSQVRSECGHATNAVCIVGRRARTKGLFLDRRAFLASYDPAQDDAEHRILTRILQAVIPVCAGINLEYLFSYTDPTGYGCGTKLPHNITSLVGVMDGVSSDLRPGLPWQMVEIHEPVRLLVIVEATPQTLLAVLEQNAAIKRLVSNNWIQLAVVDPDSAAIHLFRGGQFERYRPESAEIPAVKTSVDWYRGWRDHLGFASILGDAVPGAVRAKDTR
jgi:uncharacterized protein YbcC (UPF0753/DUF2309 family)